MISNRCLLQHPRIHRLDVGEVALPEWHPRASDKVARIFAYAIEHPDGIFLFDCGCADDNPVINDLYRPQIRPLTSLLAEVRLSIADVRAVVLSHLHFDHCGQLRLFRGSPTYVQRAEVIAAEKPGYTVPDWADIPKNDARIVDGDEWIADGLELVSTPGHTPGHQSLIVRGGGQTTIVGGQCSYCAKAFFSSVVEPDNLFEPRSASDAAQSIEKLRSYDPDRILLAHDEVETSQG
ncbi:N-acyl homoserine lactonase family protein [Aurantiacibacter poecillastricola]|uniref:N-acyl homoserine lactonase family protein n=1 Tax=Aurantiacibacter poecillastricola TaxID=3064385 RepID=UPI00273D7FFC|nr:N-acyl homoserine lactonase family protein [Aurantiacibacter sp. 219JJ12-13]MDP5263639.1 N-acyl homoserine lactonase family protein [Aurantiacibacter sp. 219JJ12-13]